MGLAQTILERPGRGLSPQDQEKAFFKGLELCGDAHLTDICGLGPAGKAKILATLEMARKYARYRASHQKTIPSSSATLAIRALSRVPEQERQEIREWLGFVPLYRTGELGHLCLVQRGSRTHVHTDPVEIFARILSLRPQGFFLVHNHPSGIARPSSEDHELTEQVNHVAQQFGLRVYGHWVVTSDGEAWISADYPRTSETS
jgi:DNA repair protein RadC